MRINFQETRFHYDDNIKKSIEMCEKHGGYLQIDENFCVYAFYDGYEHWVGYAKPHDMKWFEQRFSGITINELKEYLEELIAKGIGEYFVSSDNTGCVINKESISINNRECTLSI